MSTSADLIAIARSALAQQGSTDNRELAQAAQAYVNHYVGRAWTFANDLGMPGVVNGPETYRGEPPPDEWPWSSGWKPEAPLEDLVKAAALLSAEIDRLLLMKAVKFPMAITTARSRVLKDGQAPQVSVGAIVQRKPHGQTCRVTAVEPSRIRIHQPSRWHGWVSNAVFAKNWIVKETSS